MLVEKWPSSIVARSHVPAFSGGEMTTEYIANLDSQGLGPEGRFRIGRKICYPTESLARWFADRAKPVEDKDREVVKRISNKAGKRK